MVLLEIVTNGFIQGPAISESDFIIIVKLRKENRELKERLFSKLYKNIVVVSQLLHGPFCLFLNFIPSSFLFHRLEKKEADTLGDLVQELQLEREKCKSLEIQVCSVSFSNCIIHTSTIIVSRQSLLSCNEYLVGEMVLDSLNHCLLPPPKRK